LGIDKIELIWDIRPCSTKKVERKEGGNGWGEEGKGGVKNESGKEMASSNPTFPEGNR